MNGGVWCASNNEDLVLNKVRIIINFTLIQIYQRWTDMYLLQLLQLF